MACPSLLSIMDIKVKNSFLLAILISIGFMIFLLMRVELAIPCSLLRGGSLGLHSPICIAYQYLGFTKISDYLLRCEIFPDHNNSHFFC